MAQQTDATIDWWLLLEGLKVECARRRMDRISNVQDFWHVTEKLVSVSRILEY